MDADLLEAVRKRQIADSLLDDGSGGFETAPYETISDEDPSSETGTVTDQRLSSYLGELEASALAPKATNLPERYSPSFGEPGFWRWHLMNEGMPSAQESSEAFPIEGPAAFAQDQSGEPQQNYVLTPVQEMGSSIPASSDYPASAQARPPESLEPEYAGIGDGEPAPDTLTQVERAQPAVEPAPDTLTQVERGELVRLHPVPPVAAANRELDLAPPAELVKAPQPAPGTLTQVERAQPVEPSRPDIGIPDDYAGLDVATPAQAPAPATQPSQPSAQNYVLTPVDPATGQPLPRSVQPAQPAASATAAKTTEPATAPQTQEPDLTEPARPGSYQSYQGSEPRQIQGVIMHSSDGSLKSDINTLTGGDPSHKVSVHYYVAKDGTVHHFVNDNDIAYDVGQTSGPLAHLNNATTIGIETEHVDGTPWEDSLIRGEARLAAQLLKRYPNLSIDDFHGHSDVAPERKQDPLDFPWDKFRQYVAQDMGQQPAAPQAPVAQPGNKLANGFYQNEDPKSFISGRATTFATPDDVASGQDPGVGSAKLGKLDTTQAWGVAVPLDVLTSQLGNNPAAWRKARGDVVDPQTGKRLRLPIVDVGPSNPNALFDMTPGVSAYFGGDKTLSVKLVPNAGPDVNKDPASWGDEQAAIRQGFDSSAVSVVKVQKPQNYQLVPAAPPSAEVLAADQANQKKQIGILTQLPEAQGQSLPDLINRLDKPVDGVNDALRKSYQDEVKQQATKFAQENYGIKDPKEALARIMQPAGPLDYASQVFKSAAGHMLSMVSSFNANMASKDEDNAVKVLKLVNPDASPEQISETMKHLLNPDLSHADRERLIRDAIMVPYSQLDQAHQSTFDLAGAIESIRRLADPKYVAERNQVVKTQVDAVNNLLKPDPRLNPTAAHIIDVVSQLPAMGVQLATGPIGGSLMLSDIYKGTLDKLKAEHPEMSDAQRQDMAGRNALVQAGIMYASAGSGRLFEGMIGEIENAVTRRAVGAGAHIAAGSATLVAAKAAENLITKAPLTQGLGEAAITGAGLGAAGAVTGGRAPRENVPRETIYDQRQVQVQPTEGVQPPVVPGVQGPVHAPVAEVPSAQRGAAPQEQLPELRQGIPPQGTPSGGAVPGVRPEGAEAPSELQQAPPGGVVMPGTPPVDPRFSAKVSTDNLVNVPASEVDQRWQASPLNKNFYLEPGGQGPNYIADRYQRAQDFLESGKPMHAPEVTVREDGTIHFDDGRHRFAAMRDSGMSDVPLAMDAESLRNLQNTKATFEPVKVSESEPITSAIANRYTAERMATGELGPIEPGQGKSTEEMVQQGLGMSRNQRDGLIDGFMKGKGGNLDQQGAAIRSKEALLSEQSRVASRAAAADPPNAALQAQAKAALDEVTDFHNGPIKKFKEIWSNAGRGLQREIPLDYTTFNGMKEAYLKGNGKEAPSILDPKLKQMAQRVSKTAEAERAAFDNLGKEIDKQTRGKAVPTEDQIRAKLMEIMKDLPCPT